MSHPSPPSPSTFSGAVAGPGSPKNFQVGDGGFQRQLEAVLGAARCRRRDPGRLRLPLQDQQRVQQRLQRLDRNLRRRRGPQCDCHRPDQRHGIHVPGAAVERRRRWQGVHRGDRHADRSYRSSAGRGGEPERECRGRAGDAGMDPAEFRRAPDRLRVPLQEHRQLRRLDHRLRRRRGSQCDCHRPERRRGLHVRGTGGQRHRGRPGVRGDRHADRSSAG